MPAPAGWRILVAPTRLVAIDWSLLSLAYLALAIAGAGVDRGRPRAARTDELSVHPLVAYLAPRASLLSHSTRLTLVFLFIA